MIAKVECSAGMEELQLLRKERLEFKAAVRVLVFQSGVSPSSES